MKSLPTFLILSLLMTSVGLSPGCSRPAGRNVETGNIVITVTNGDQPATGLTVRALSTSGESGGLGDLDASGKVTLENLDVGEYRVAIYPSAPGNPVPEGVGQAAPAPAKPVDVPKALLDEARTPARVTVSKGSSTATINLKDY